MLTDDELAFMREVQDDARPTAATVEARAEVPDGMGGFTTSNGAPVPVTIRVRARDQRTPEALVEKYGANVVTITLDHDAEVVAGDRITVDEGEAYEVVSHGDPNAWTTAQRVYAVRRVWPS